MDYRNRKIDIRNKNITEFLRQLAVGEFLVPTFQRVFVWDPEHIIDLWDSILRCFPIGSILYWKTHARLHVHKRLGGFYLPEEGVPKQKMRSYILDGQQRATSLLASFQGGTGKVKEQYSFDYTLYFDLTRADFFFEKDYYRHRWDTDSAFLIRLKDVPDLPVDYCCRLACFPVFSESIEKNLEQLKYVFANYRVPLVGLEGFDIADVCGIYERINQTGVRLTNTDILIARGFRNYAIVVEEDFPIS